MLAKSYLGESKEKGGVIEVRGHERDPGRFHEVSKSTKADTNELAEDVVVEGELYQLSISGGETEGYKPRPNPEVSGPSKGIGDTPRAMKVEPNEVVINTTGHDTEIENKTK